MPAATMLIPKRTAIVGGSGAGKTTLGKRLSALLECPFVEVDAIQHKADWSKASRDDVRIGVQMAIGSNSTWVIDDICQLEMGDLVSRQADLIVWLDLPLPMKLLRLFKRSWRRVRTSEVLWNGNVETWRATCS